MKTKKRKLGAYAQAIKDVTIIVRCDMCSSRNLDSTNTCNNCGRKVGRVL